MPGDNDDKKKVLYDAVSKDYDVGTYDEFTQKLNDPSKRKALYDAIGEDYDLGDYQSFNKKLGYDSEEVKNQTPSFIKPFNQVEHLQAEVDKQDSAPQQEQPKGIFGSLLNSKKPIGVKPKADTSKPDIKEAIDNSVNKYFESYGENNTSITDADRQQQRENVIQQYKSGNLVPVKQADGTSVMKRGTGFFESLTNAITETHNRNLEDKILSGLPKKEAIKWLNIDRKNPGLLFNKESETAPSGFFGDLGQGIGENLEFLGKATTGAIAGASTELTGGAGTGAFIATAQDIASSGYSQALRNNYNKLKSQDPNISDEEAFDKAQKAALANEAVQLGVNAVLSKAVPEGLPTPTISNNGVVNAVTESLKHTVQTAPKVLGTTAIGSLTSDLASKLSGVDVSLDESLNNIVEHSKGMAIMHFGLGVLGASVNGLKESIPPYVRPQVENLVASAPRQEVEQFYRKGELTGEFPIGTTDKVLNKLSEFDQQKAIVDKLPLSEESKAAITGKLIQRNDLINQREELAKYGSSFNDQMASIDNKIKNVESDINGITKTGNPFEFERDNLTGEKATGDIAKEPIKVEENGEGQRREERRQDVLNQPQEAVKEDTVEQPTVSSIEDEKNVAINSLSDDNKIVYEQIRDAVTPKSEIATVKMQRSPQDRVKFGSKDQHDFYVTEDIAKEAYRNYAKSEGEGVQSYEQILKRGGFSASELDRFAPHWRRDLYNAISKTELPNEKQTKAQVSSIEDEKKYVSRFPLPDKPIHEMNSEELDAYADKVRTHNKGLEVEFFGKEGAKKYREAQSISNGYLASDEKRQEAYKTIDEMEASLTPEQQNEFFGINAPKGLEYESADIRDIASKVRLVEEAENADDLATSIKNALSRFNKENPSNESLAILNAAKKRAAELNINPADLIKEVLKKVGGQYKDLDDAEFMMKNAYDALTSTPPEKIEPKQLSNEKQTKAQEPNIQTMEGGNTSNEPKSTSKGSQAEGTIPENSQTTKIGGENASTQTNGQQQESVQQGSQPEYARAEQAGSERTPTSTEGSDSNIRSQVQEEVSGGGKVLPEQPPLTEQGEPLKTNQRRFTQQMMRTEDLSPENKAEVAKTLDYAVQTNAMSMKEANEIINKVGLDESYNLITDRNNNMNGGVRVTLAQALIKSFNELASKAEDAETKNFYNDKAIKAANYTTEILATDAGQSIQAFSLWSRLSPEAQFRAAQEDMRIQGEDKKQRRKKDVNTLGDKFKKVNEETAKTVTEDKEVKETITKQDNERVKKAKDRVQKAKAKRASIIKKYKGSKGQNLFSTLPGLSTEGIEFVGEVAKTYIDEGIANIELLVEKIKEALKEVSGKVVPDEYTQQIKDIADDRLNRADKKLLGAEMKNQQMKINDIVQQHYTVADAAKKSLAEKLVEQAGLTGEEAKELSDKVSAAFDRIATRRKNQILFQEKSRFDRIQKGLTGANKIDRKTLQGEMIRYSNLGAFDNEAFGEMIAEKLGTGKIGADQAAKIKELSEKIEKAPEGTPKNDATEDLLAYRANLRGRNWAEIAQGAWYAEVLSGYKTHEKNIVSTFFSGMGELAAQAAKNPLEAPFLLYGGLKGLKRGLLEGGHTILTGRSPIHVKKIETPNILERTDFMFGKFNPANWLKYVTRAMVAEDVFQFQGLKEARAYQLASREAQKELGTKNPFSKAVWEKVDELLLNTKDRYDEALSQAKSEGLKSDIDIKRRVYELMEQSRPTEMTEDAYGFAAHGTFNHDTEGTLGALTNAISNVIDVPVGGFQPLRFVVPFTRIITNVVNNYLDYTPVGLIRAARGQRGFEAFKDYAIAKKAYIKLTPEQRKTLVAKASIGIGLAAGLYALSQQKDKDGKPIIEITGGGTGDYKKDQQLRDNGWQEYSIKIGDTYYSYKLTPLMFMLGFVGNMNDKQKYAQNPDDATMLKQMELAMYRTGYLASDATWINSAGTLFGALTQPNPSGQVGEIGNALTQSVKGAVIPQAYTQLAQEYENIFHLPQKQVNSMWENMIQDVPIARNKLNDKINALGEPIVRDVDVLTSEETKDPVWRFLLDKGGWVAPVSKNSMVVFDGKNERAITDDEYYKFSKLRGEKIKQAILDLLKRDANVETETEEDVTDEYVKAKDLTKGQLQQLLKSISTQATKDAKEELFNPEGTSKPRVTVTINEE